MTATKRYEILESLPTYGPMYISVAGDGDEAYYSQGFTVKFVKENNSEWVANFKPGWTQLNEVFEFDNTTNLLVIAGGICYVMNPNETKPISVFGAGFETVIKTPDGRLILQGMVDITVVEKNGDHWHTERISWDGLKDLKIEGKMLTGLSYDPMNRHEEWVKFALDIETKKVIGGSYRQYEFKPVGENVMSVHKKRNWLKFFRK